MADSETRAPVADEYTNAGLFSQLGMMLRALRQSSAGKTLLLLNIGVTVVIGATAFAQVRLNTWNKPFFDALSRRDMRDFLFQLGVFFIIAGALLVLNVAQRWLVETLKVKLRQGLTQDLIKDWLLPRRAFWLANAGPMGVNPDQRIHEDARKLCELSADLGTGLLQAAILFGSFAGVLWLLSSNFSFRIEHRDYVVPGFMLWAAVLYASAGSLVSYWVGGSLINRNAERYAREADLRFSLVRINEHLDGISLAAGEEDERRRVETHLESVLAAMQRLVTGLTNLTWVTAGFGWVTIVAPILVAAPLYFTGKITFGGLMQAAAAFTQAQSSLRWFVDNFSTIADWRATLLRVASFRQALTSAAEGHELESRITYADGEPGTMRFEQLEVAAAEGGDMLKERSVELHPGERVLIVGAPGTSNTLLFRALAGLWPWGSGVVRRARDETIFYLPRGTPYLPRGTLREVLAYPWEADKFAADSFARALDSMGLDRLKLQLDEVRRWDRELSQDEQLALSFARLQLQAPPWVLIDDTIGSLDDEAREQVVDIFSHELVQSTLINIGKATEARDPFFSRVLHLVKAPPKPTTAPAGPTAADVKAP